MTITTIYDNYLHRPDLEKGWGFSCLVEAGDNKILFDTGEEPQSLLSNVGELGTNPESIDSVFLSHRHWDHVGGLEGFLEENPNVTVYLLESFPGTMKRKAEDKGAELIEIKNYEKIFDGVASTGEMRGPPSEQSMLVSTEKGLVVITGCAHPGIVKIVERAKKLTGENIYLVIGGFHLGDLSDSSIEKIISSFRKLGVDKAAPCHCSGDRARKLFRDEYGEDFIENGVGMKIKI